MYFLGELENNTIQSNTILGGDTISCHCKLISNSFDDILFFNVSGQCF